MKIEYDEQSNIIRVGKAEFTSYHQFKNSATFASFVLSKNGIHIQIYKNKEQNKKIADLLGCSRTVLFKHFDKLQKKVFIAPVYDIIKKVSKYQGGARFDSNAIYQVNKHKEILTQVYDDGLYNLLPLVAAFGKSPQELKKEYKSAWKTLSNNSLNKNKILAKKGAIKVGELADKPVTLIKYGYDEQTLEFLANHFKGKWKDTSEMTKQAYFFSDTKRMADQLAQDVNPKWTPRRMKEEHDRMSKEITARKYSKDVFDSVKDIPVKSLNFGEYTATLLDNAFAIADEGNSMGHCVAGYSDYVRKGEYLVYSVTKDGQRSSTVGINAQHILRDVVGVREPVKSKSWKLQQHYGRYNASVKDEDEKKLGQMLLEELNKKLDNPEN